MRPMVSGARTPTVILHDAYDRSTALFIILNTSTLYRVYKYKMLCDTSVEHTVVYNIQVFVFQSTVQQYPPKEEGDMWHLRVYRLKH